MKTALKNRNWRAFATLLFMAILAQSFQSYALPDNICPQPYNLELRGTTSSSISVAWSASGTVQYYKVWVYRHEDGYTSAPQTTTSLSHTFTGLGAGTYDVFVVGVCEEETSVIIVMEDVLI